MPCGKNDAPCANAIGLGIELGSLPLRKLLLNLLTHQTGFDFLPDCGDFLSVRRGDKTLPPIEN